MNPNLDPAMSDAAPPRQREMSIDSGSVAVPAFDPFRLLAAFRANWLLFTLIAGGVLAAFVIGTALLPRQYTSTAGVVLEAAQKQDPSATQPFAPLPADSSTVDTEVQLIQSRDLADQVVTALKLDRDSTVLPRGTSATSQDPERRHDAAVAFVRRGLRVRRSGLTSVMAISFTSLSPALSQRLANGVVDQYLVAQRQAKLSTAKLSGQSLTDKLASLKQAAFTADAAVAQYRNANGLFGGSGAELTQQQASSYEQQLAQARADLAAEESRLTVAKTQVASGDASTVALESGVMQQLRGRRSELTSQIADLGNRYGALYPELVKAKSQLQDVDAQIQAEIRRAVSELQTKAQVARGRVSSLQGELGRAHGRLSGSTSASVRLAELERTATAARTVYESFLNRSQQANATVGTELPDARVSSRAELPVRASSPNVPLNLALGVLFALGGGIGAVYARETLHPGLLTGEEVERKLGLPLLGSIPELSSIADDNAAKLSPVDYLMAKPLSSFSEAVRGLRTSLRFSGMGEGGSKVVALTSALPNEGKSTTAVCLARATAQAGHRVLLIDCDMRKRGVNTHLNIRPEKGLLEVLSGASTLDDAMILDQASGAYILPAVSSGQGSTELFETAALNALLRECSSRFDLVLLDTAPVLAVAETRVLTAKSDTVIFLAHWRKTPEKAILAAIKLLESSGAHLSGVALTQVNMRLQARYGYGDSTYYYGKYKKYYASEA